MEELSSEMHTFERIDQYIDQLEKTNEELLTSLKHCVRLLENLKVQVPNPKRWQDLLLRQICLS